MSARIGSSSVSCASAAEALLVCMEARGADVIFGNPGSSEIALIEALADRGSPEFILGLTEPAAVGMADGYAAVTRRPAVVTVHAGPGLSNALCALGNAQRGGTPLVVVAGQQDSRHLSQDPILSADLVALADQYCKSAVQVARPEDVPAEFARSWDLARTFPTGPTFLAVPMDVFGAGPVTVTPPAEFVVDVPAQAATITLVLDLLRQATAPAVVAGDQAGMDGAEDMLSALCAAIDAPLYAEPAAARMVLPFTDPAWRGYLPLSPSGVRAALADHDVVLVIGARPFTRWLHEDVAALSPEQTLVVADTRSFHPFPCHTVQVPASPAAFIRGLLDALGVDQVTKETSGLGTAAETAAEIAAEIAAESGAPLADAAQTAAAAGSPWEASVAIDVEGRRPTIPAALAALLAALPSDAAVVDDSVTGEGYVREILERTGVAEYYSCKGGGLGWGVAFAVGVARARPSRPVLAILGDGTLQYAAPALWTAAHLDLPVVFAVLRNDGYGILKWVERSRRGDDAAAVGLDIEDPEADLVALGQAYGVKAARADGVVQIAQLARAAWPGPYLIDIPVDRAVLDYE